MPTERDRDPENRREPPQTHSQQRAKGNARNVETDEVVGLAVKELVPECTHNTWSPTTYGIGLVALAAGNVLLAFLVDEARQAKQDCDG